MDITTTPRPFAISGWSRARRYGWLAILVFSPLAYLAATLLQNQLAPESKFVSIHRDQAVAIGRAFAAGLHMDARSWRDSTMPQSHKLMRALFQRQHPPALERVTAPTTITVALSAPARDRWIMVDVTPQGRVVGFVADKPKHAGAPPDEPSAKALAETTLRSMLGPDTPFVLSGPTVGAPDPQHWEREFDWKSPIPGLTRTKANFHVRTDGLQVVTLGSSVELDPDLEQSLRTNPAIEITLGIFIAICYTALGAFALVRYIKRSLEKEISHRRTILAVLTVLTINLAVGWFNGVDVPWSNGAPPNDWQRLLMLALVFGLFGLAFGIAYGAGEGDLREAFPGKLSSLDAFLAGKFLSANFARSILAGGAIAGWMFLFQNLFLFLARTPPVGSPGDLVEGALLHVPVASLASSAITNSASLTVFGLLLPLTMLRSRLRRRWLFYSALALLSGAIVYSLAPDGNSLLNSLFLTALFTAAAWIPFSKGDLLAAISSVAALAFVGELVRRSSLSDQWHHIAYHQVLPVGVLFLVTELYFAWRGNVYEESEVRPLYARHLADRLALTAEIGAARQAQLRLLPDAPPLIAGLSIAGSCTPAREVGGDFFDYYAIDDHRLGVFVAEGGNRELGSAMAIALAKGFVMYSARLDISAIEMLRRLRIVLGTILRGERAPMTLLYAVINARTGALNYARAGASPRLLINGGDLAEAIVTDPVDGWEIRHGAATLHPGDVLFFYTDGWAGQIASFARRTPQAFLAGLAKKHAGASAGELHVAAIRSAGRFQTESPADDVTAVVVRLEERAAERIGGIA
ncbi:MAG: SpoIIE family protein phosphatase [Bryobacteraceae bacterium]